jgi:hypothetical protein
MQSRLSHQAVTNHRLETRFGRTPVQLYRSEYNTDQVLITQQAVPDLRTTQRHSHEEVNVCNAWNTLEYRRRRGEAGEREYKNAKTSFWTVPDDL